MEFEAIIEGVQKLSTEQLKEVRHEIDKQLSEKRVQEIETALEQAKKAASENKLTFYSSGENLLSLLNED